MTRDHLRCGRCGRWLREGVPGARWCPRCEADRFERHGWAFGALIVAALTVLAAWAALHG